MCSIRLYQSAIADADDPMSLFISILKDVAEEIIPKTSRHFQHVLINHGFMILVKIQSKSATFRSFKWGDGR